MKAVTVVLRPSEGFHPANEALANEHSVTRVAIHHIQLLDDGTVVLLYEIRGNLARAEQILSNHPDVKACDVSGSDNGVAFIHCQPTSISSALLELPKKYEIALNVPIEHVQDGGVRLTLVAEQSVLQQVLSEMPTNMDVSLERIEDYQRANLQAPPLLTDRQQEIADVAVQEGYYDIPRQISQQELAQKFDISVGTLAEHLRKIEQRVFKQLY